MRTVRLPREKSRTGPLVLVNRQHPLQPGGPVDLTAVDSRPPDILLDRQAARLLAAFAQGLGKEAEALC